MDFPVKTRKDLSTILSTVIFNAGKNTRCLKSDYKHNFCQEYKNVDWTNTPFVSTKLIRELFPQSIRFDSHIKLRKNLRKHSKGYSTNDVMDELLRREIVCSADDTYWNKSERYFLRRENIEKRRKEAKKRKRALKPKKRKRAKKEYYTLHLKGIVFLKNLGPFRMTKKTKEKLKFIEEEFAKRAYIFDKEHPLWVREKQLRGFFTNYYPIRNRKFTSLDDWIQEYCWASVKAKKLAGYKVQGEKMKELRQKKKW